MKTTVLLCKCSWFRAKNIDQMCTSYKLKKQLFDRKLIFFYEERNTYYSSKISKEVYVTILRCILYSIWVHVESPKYKMVCLNSPKSSEFAKKKNKQWSEILKYLTVGIRTHNPWRLRLRNTCAIGCAKKTPEYVFKQLYTVHWIWHSCNILTKSKTIT